MYVCLYAHSAQGSQKALNPLELEFDGCELPWKCWEMTWCRSSRRAVSDLHCEPSLQNLYFILEETT